MGTARFGAGAILVIALVAALAPAMRRADRSIGPDKEPPRPEAVPEAVPLDPALPTVPQAHDPRPAPHPLTEPLALTPVDTIEPWTGEDIAQKVELALRDRAGIDRRDPWDPSVVYPESTPPDLDHDEPWTIAPRAGLAKADAPKTHDALAKRTAVPDRSAADIWGAGGS